MLARPPDATKAGGVDVGTSALLASVPKGRRAEEDTEELLDADSETERRG